MSPLPLLPPAGLLPGTPTSPAVFPPSVLDPTYLSPSSQPFAPCLDPQWGGGQFVCRGSRREGNTDAGTHLSSPGRCSWEEADPHSTLPPQGKPSGCRSQGLLPAPRGPQAEAAAPSHPPSQAPSPPLHCRALTQVRAAGRVAVRRGPRSSAGLWRHLLGAAVTEGGGGLCEGRGLSNGGAGAQLWCFLSSARAEATRAGVLCLPMAPERHPWPQTPLVPPTAGPSSYQVICVASAGHSTSLSLNILLRNREVIITAPLVHSTGSFQETPALSLSRLGPRPTACTGVPGAPWLDDTSPVFP